jgi:hypothetical protein
MTHARVALKLQFAAIVDQCERSSAGSPTPETSQVES